MAKRRARRTLYHYTDEKGLNGILASQRVHPSTFSRTPKDVRYGNGQYFADMVPGTRSAAELSRAFLGFPFQKQRFTHFVEIDVTGFRVIRGRTGIFLIRNEKALNIVGRIVRSGKVEVS